MIDCFVCFAWTVPASGFRLCSDQLHIQSEGAEAYYRRIEIRPITDYPADIRAAAGFDPCRNEI